MKPVLLQFKEKEFKQHLETYQPALIALNQILNAYNELGYKLLSETEFKNLVNYPLETIFDILTENRPIQIGGLEVDKKQALALIKKPAGLAELEALITEYRHLPHNAQVFNYAKLIDGKIMLSDVLINKDRKTFEVWATTEKAIKAWEFINTVIAAANKCFGEDCVNIGTQVSNFIGYGVYEYGGVGNGFREKAKNYINYEKVRDFGGQQFV